MYAVFRIPKDYVYPTTLRLTPMLQGFVDAFRKSNPAIHLLYHSPRRVGVYYDNAVYTSGELSVDDATFTVASPTVRNGKFKAITNAHYTTSTAKLDAAVRNARAHIRPLLASEEAAKSRDAMINAARKVLAAPHDIDRKLRSVWNIDAKNSPIVAEMRNILSSGYKFADLNLRDSLVAWMDNADAAQAARAAKHFVYVRVVPTDVGTDVMMQRQTTTEAPYLYGMDSTPDLSMTVRIDHVDPGVLGRVSVLMMVEEGVYVDGVGYRHGPQEFYVEWSGELRTTTNPE